MSPAHARDSAATTGLGRDGEPGLDDVDAERVQLLRQADLLVDPHRETRRLLAVAQRRVEHRQAVVSHGASMPHLYDAPGHAGKVIILTIS
jgi:hypothetical protein